MAEEAATETHARDFCNTGKGDHVEWLGKLPGPHLCLVDTCFDAFVEGHLLEIAHRDGFWLESVSILASGSSSRILTFVREVQRCIEAQLRDKLRATLECHLQCVVVAEVAVQHEVGERQEATYPCQQCLDHALDVCQLREASVFDMELLRAKRVFALSDLAALIN